MDNLNFVFIANHEFATRRLSRFVWTDCPVEKIQQDEMFFRATMIDFTSRLLMVCADLSCKSGGRKAPDARIPTHSHGKRTT